MHFEQKLKRSNDGFNFTASVSSDLTGTAKIDIKRSQTHVTSTRIGIEPNRFPKKSLLKDSVETFQTFVYASAPAYETRRQIFNKNSIFFSLILVLYFLPNFFLNFFTHFKWYDYILLRIICLDQGFPISVKPLTPS